MKILPQTTLKGRNLCTEKNFVSDSLKPIIAVRENSWKFFFYSNTETTESLRVGLVISLIPTNITMFTYPVMVVYNASQWDCKIFNYDLK